MRHDEASHRVLCTLLVRRLTCSFLTLIALRKMEPDDRVARADVRGGADGA